ncbi:MAG: tetratricopeptide repeat protein [Pseudomonadota bacterium]
MLKDCFGSNVSTDDAANLVAINDFIQGFIRYETRAAGILKAAGCDCALANAYCGILFLFLESPEAPERAAPHLAAAQTYISAATPREKFTLDYAKAWLNAQQQADYKPLLQLGEDARKRFPQDLVLMKLHQYHCFNAGDAPAMLRAAQAAHQQHPGVAQVFGMLAFGYEQCHWLAEAEDAAKAALALEKKEPWAQHALAHVMLTQGRIAEGARFLEGVEDTWDGLNSFMLTHLWWHRALFYLSLGRFDDALNVYDNHTLNADPSYSQDQIGAVSLLARLELAGIDVEQRWSTLGQLLKGRAHDVVQPFLSLQYLYGLAKAGMSEADELLDAIKTQRASGWQSVAQPAAQALYAHAKADWDTAYQHMSLALPLLREIGGSHAQRDLFEQIALDAAIRSERYVIAQQMIEARRQFDPIGVPLMRQRAHVNAALEIAES